MHLAEAVYRDDVAAPRPAVLRVGEILPGLGRRQALVGAVAEADRAREGAHADDLVADGVGVNIGKIWNVPHVELWLDQPGLDSLPLLAGVGVEHVVKRRALRRRLKLRIIGKCRVSL